MASVRYLVADVGRAVASREDSFVRGVTVSDAPTVAAIDPVPGMHRTGKNGAGFVKAVQHTHNRGEPRVRTVRNGRGARTAPRRLEIP